MSSELSCLEFSNDLLDLISDESWKKIVKNSMQDLSFNNIFASISDQFYKENFHSDILAFLFNFEVDNTCPVLVSFINYIANEFKEGSDELKEVTTNAPSNKIKIFREKYRIDILIKIKNISIIIESKINGAHDQDNQINEYFNKLKLDGIDGKKIYAVYIPRYNEKPNYEIDNSLIKRFIVLPINSSDDKKSLLGFLEESKEQNDNIANFLICQYKALFGNIMNESIVDLKSDLYSKVKDIFDNPKKRKEFKSILEQLNEINGQWDRRGDCIFSYFIEKWKKNKNWKNADLAGYPNILQRRSKKGITVYLQGGYGSQIQIGVYNKGCFKEKRSIENKFNNKLPSSEYPLKWAGANRWCYTFIDVDRFKDFEDAKKQISGITEYLVQNC